MTLKAPDGLEAGRLAGSSLYGPDADGCARARECEVSALGTPGKRRNRQGRERLFRERRGRWAAEIDDRQPAVPRACGEPVALGRPSERQQRSFHIDRPGYALSFPIVNRQGAAVVTDRH